jgi:hypothetical protein
MLLTLFQNLQPIIKLQNVGGENLSGRIILKGMVKYMRYAIVDSIQVVHCRIQ